MLAVCDLAAGVMYFFDRRGRSLALANLRVIYGRDVVGADKIDDKQTEQLSTDIATKIQNEMTYPGQVKITVIRETRSIAYAK